MRPCWLAILLCYGLVGGGCTSTGNRFVNIRDLATPIPHDNHPGTQVLRVTTDSRGRIASVVIIKSSGSAMLDNANVDHAKNHWVGPPHTTKDVVLYMEI